MTQSKIPFTDLQGTAFVEPKDLSRMIVVSNNGADSNTGLHSNYAVATITNAITKADNLPGTQRAGVFCPDFSVFNENITPQNGVDLQLEGASIIGNISSSSNDTGVAHHNKFNIRSVTGDVSIVPDDTLDIYEVTGDINVPSGQGRGTHIAVEKWLSGALNINPNTTGVLYVDIKEVHTSFIQPTIPDNLTVIGNIGDAIYGERNEVDLTLTKDSTSNTVSAGTGDNAVLIGATAVDAGIVTAKDFQHKLALEGGVYYPDYDVSSQYPLKSIVLHNNKFYYCIKATGNPAGPFNPVDWEEINLKALVDAHDDFIRNILMLRGQDIPAEFNATTPYTKGDFVFRATDNFIYQAKTDLTAGPWILDNWIKVSVLDNVDAQNIITRLSNETGDDRLDASAIKNLPSNSDTAEDIRDKLKTLTGINRLPDDAIYFENKSGTLNPSGGSWIDIATWSPNSGEKVSESIKFTWTCSDSSNKVIFGADIFAGVINSTDAVVQIAARRADYSLGEQAIYRVIRDTSATDSKIRVQFYSGLSGDYTFNIVKDPSSISENLEWGNFALYAPTGSEAVLKTLDVTNWENHAIAQGSTGGVAAGNIGDEAGTQAWIDFSKGDVDIYAGNQIVQKVSSHGTRFSAGEYGTWGTDSPEPAFPTNSLSSVTNNKRPNNDDTTGNPLSTVTCNLSDASTGSGLIRWDTIDGHAIIRLIGNSVANRGSMRHRFEGATIGQKIRVTHKWWKAADATMQHTARLDGPEGPTLKVLTLPSSNPNSAFYTTDFEYTVTAEDALRGYTDIFLSNTGSGTTGYYLYSYRVDIVVDEPPLQTNVVGQFDSVYRGILLPRIVPVSSDEHTRGVIALDELGMRNPVYYNGDNWSNFAVTRNDTADVQYGTYYSSEFGTGALEDQGFEQTTGTKMTVVQDHQGFPQLLRTNANSTVSIFSTIDDTDEFWQAAWDRGLVVTHRVMAADTSRDLHMNIEPRNSATSWGTGRFTYNITNDSSGNSVLELERANGGSSTFEVPITKNVMHTINVIIPPSTGVATVILDGQVVGTAGLGGYNGQRGICTFTVGGAAGDYYLQQYGITIMEATATSKTLTVKEITDSIRYVIPTTANDFELTMPKGLLPVGTTFTVVNGGSREATIKGADDDLQLFGGNTIGRVPAGEECIFVQTGFPTGNIWTMSNRTARRTPTSQGHSLHMKINSSGNIVNRHGTYTADDVQVTRPNTGDYQIAIGGHVFTSTNFLITATPDGSNVAARKYFASAGLGAIGEAGVWFRDESGVARNTTFNVSIYW